MTVDEIHSFLIELSTLYDNLIKEWKEDPCNSSIFQVSNQKYYHDFYEKVKNLNPESTILEIFANSLNPMILARLRNAIEASILLYETRKDRFNGIDFYKICTDKENDYFNRKIQSIELDNKDIEISQCLNKEEKEKMFQENAQEMKKVLCERGSFIMKNEWLYKNHYLKIYELSKYYLSIIEGYLSFGNHKDQAPTPTEKDQPLTPIPEANLPTSIPEDNSTTHFDMNLISKIYKICNNVQFNFIPELDFYKILNGQSTDISLTVKAGETIRVCYLIYKLYDQIQTDNKSVWRTNILKLLGISEDTYKSKYKESSSQDSGKKSREFSKTIDQIFKS